VLWRGSFSDLLPEGASLEAEHEGAVNHHRHAGGCHRRACGIYPGAAAHEHRRPRVIGQGAAGLEWSGTFMRLCVPPLPEPRTMGIVVADRQAGKLAATQAARVEQHDGESEGLRARR
jgi:hypothetical protein